MNRYLGFNCSMKSLYGTRFKMVFLLSCIITLKNCKKETQSSNCNDVNISYLIADTIVKKIPYIGNGNLVFVNSNKDTVKLEGCLNVNDFKIGNGTFTNGNCKVNAVYNFENKKVFLF